MGAGRVVTPVPVAAPAGVDNVPVRPALLLALLLLAGCGRGNESLSKATALHPAGREVFERYNCARCHAEGEGAYGARMIGNPALRDLEYIKERIRAGKTVGASQMPPFAGMPKAELDEVARFVRALAGWEE